MTGIRTGGRMDKKKENRSRLLHVLLPFAAMIFVIILFAILTKGKLIESANLKRLMTQAYTVMLVGLGASFIYMHGGIDFSLGSVLALSELCAALLFEATGFSWILLPVTILVSVGCGFITGLIAVKLNVPPFIASLCMQLAGRGILTAVLDARMVSVTSLKAPTWTERWIVLAIVIIGVVILGSYTKVGKYNKAIGENNKTVYGSGVNISKYRILAYIICGACVGIAASFDLRRVGVLAGNTGLGLEMEVLIALVLGGLSLTGGYVTSVRSAIIGSITVVVLNNGLTIMGVNSNYMGIVEGIVFLFMVLFTYKRTRGKNTLLPR